MSQATTTQTTSRTDALLERVYQEIVAYLGTPSFFYIASYQQETEQVRFEQGSYRFLFVYSRASAQVAVTTDAGEIPAEIKLLHVPFAGWSVQTFEVGDLRPQQGESSSGRAELTLPSTS